MKPITDPARLLPAKCPVWFGLFMGNEYGWGWDHPWRHEARTLAARSFLEKGPTVARTGLTDEFGPCYVDVYPGRILVSASTKRRLDRRQPPEPQSCADAGEYFVPISPRFRRRRCACGSVSLRKTNQPPMTADGLEHRRRGCAKVGQALRLEDYFPRQDELAAAKETLVKVERLVRYGITPDQEPN